MGYSNSAEKTCASCGKPFKSCRSDKRSCSATCRKAVSRGSKTRWVKAVDMFGEIKYRVPRNRISG